MRNNYLSMFNHFFDSHILTNNSPHHPSSHKTVHSRSHEEDTQYILEVDVPGVLKEDLTISVHNGNILEISTKKITPDTEDKKVSTHHRDYHTSFYIPKDIDINHITAELSHGVLRLSIAKAAEKQPRQIDIKEAS